MQSNRHHYHISEHRSLSTTVGSQSNTIIAKTKFILFFKKKKLLSRQGLASQISTSLVTPQAVVISAILAVLSTPTAGSILCVYVCVCVLQAHLCFNAIKFQNACYLFTPGVPTDRAKTRPRMR